MRINYTAPPHVCDVISNFGRTEDVRFSPDRRRLAVALFIKNKIALLNISIAASDSKKIIITDAAEISSACLKSPHGIDFVNDETLIVANRDGDASILKLPAGDTGNNTYELTPIEVIRAGDIVKTPGSVSVIRKNQNLYEVLICNNYTHKVTRHLLDLSTGCFVKSNEVLLNKWLNIPDGLSISRGKQWIAISNHNTHSVLIYENKTSLNVESDPDGILRCVYYPHGLRFTSDDRFIVVADAGAPYVHIYGNDGSSWRGVRNPLLSLRVMDDEDFLRGRGDNPKEGGPKGIDIDPTSNILVTTSKWQPLAFFDLTTILEVASCSIHSNRHHGSSNGMSHDLNQSELEIRYELEMQDKLNQAEAQLDARAERDAIVASRSWRITAPLRWFTKQCHRS